MNSRYLAVDTETLGLKTLRDRLCVVQMCNEDGITTLVQTRNYQAPLLKKVLEAPGVTKIFHFARFDLAALKHWLHVDVNPSYCTKIASRLIRTYTGSHGLKDLTQELLGITLDKQQQSSDWAADTLTPAQVGYAASDVTHLIAIKERLDALLERENRAVLAADVMACLPARVRLDLAGWEEEDIFAHH
ncbi:MAG: ribonuclease D [Magnetococcales bacterium]|nr:ribonuclease D [Magnetococcales bacterium]